MALAQRVGVLVLRGGAMNRRSFLATILTSAVAPAIVRADSLMRIVPRDALMLGVDFGAGDSTVAVWLATRLRHCLIEQELDTITAHAIGDNVRELYTLNFRRYATEIELELPPNIALPRALRLDGRAAPLPPGARVEHDAAGVRVLRLPELDLTEYGNCIPSIEVQGDEP